MLWNAVEAAEQRADSQLARIINAALPTELTPRVAFETAARFATNELVARGFIVDLTISSHQVEDQAFLHAYFMFPMRTATDVGLGPKHRKPDYRGELLSWQHAWAEHLNFELEAAGSEARVDPRSHKERGLPVEPIEHQRLAARNVARRGLDVDR